ncbi:P-loop NTPase family protein [Pseudozobellia thermophila]|uniref:IstB-like ATP binding protein n=1 Tax=Pseudozobellia thermophila TaxID=192903 RepID=A0A1M6C5T7_9FLAO|nr:ATP-binding protein [Pseudozobellia thermophila]SHI56114.1 hypothetical protein SAMN04488513_101644 [Pseudozobellia thermophila]
MSKLVFEPAFTYPENRYFSEMIELPGGFGQLWAFYGILISETLRSKTMDPSYKLTRSAVWQQLKNDLIGKDSHRGVSLTYSWLANQFGHISLGVIPTMVVYVLLRNYSSYEAPAIWAGIFVSMAWLLFELYNFLGPLLIRRQTGSKLFYRGSGNRFIFSPQWRNIAFDTFTDLCFFWFGALTTAGLIAYDGVSRLLSVFGFTWVFVVVFFVFGFMVYASRYWYMVKMYQNYAYYPYQFRLSQWDYNMDGADVERVLAYTDKCKDQNGNHMLIFGEKGSGKSSLGVGIANEVSITRKAALYVTGVKLYGMFLDQIGPNKLKRYWTWKQAAILVVDDINPGRPIREELVSPQKLLQFIDCYGQDQKGTNRSLLKNKNVVWILGDDQISSPGEWTQLLQDLGVEASKITSIFL